MVCLPFIEFAAAISANATAFSNQLGLQSTYLFVSYLLSTPLLLIT